MMDFTSGVITGFFIGQTVVFAVLYGIHILKERAHGHEPHK